MKELYRKAIDQCRKKLSESIWVGELVAHGRLENFTADDGTKFVVLSEQDQATVDAEVGPDFKLVAFLDILQRKPDKVFDWLLKYLRSKGHTDVADTLGCLGKESAPGSNTPPPLTSSQADDRQGGVASVYNELERMSEDERTTVTGTHYFGSLAKALKGRITDVLAVLKAERIFKESTCETVQRKEGSLAQAMKIIEILAQQDRGKVGLYEALNEVSCVSLYKEIFRSL